MKLLFSGNFNLYYYLLKKKKTVNYSVFNVENIIKIIIVDYVKNKLVVSIKC